MTDHKKFETIKKLGIPEFYNNYYWLNDKNILHPETIFVFGSNEAGRHGLGAALQAKLDYGAILGQGVGFMGRSYGIPTKDKNMKILDLDTIGQHIVDFVEITKTSGRHFYVTPVGCGLAGYTPAQIAPMFQGARRCWFPITFKTFID